MYVSALDLIATYPAQRRENWAHKSFIGRIMEIMFAHKSALSTFVTGTAQKYVLSTIDSDWVSMGESHRDKEPTEDVV